MLKQLAVVTLAVSALGCTVKPGDYRVYRYAVDDVITNCTPAIEPDPDITSDETFFNTTLLSVFATDTDTFFLEFGADAITGTRDGKEYTFVGTSNTTWAYHPDEDGVGSDFTASESRELTVTLTLNGKGMTGDVFERTIQTCTGSNMDCGLVAKGNVTCESTSTVFGTQVDDVDFEYVLNGGAGGGP